MERNEERFSEPNALTLSDYDRDSGSALSSSSAAHASSAGTSRRQEDKQPEIYFPAANVARIMKRVLPLDAKVSKDSISLVQESACNFISFISSEAGVRCLSDKRKTVTGDDIISALNSLGFDSYGEVLSIFLEKYRASVDGKQPHKKLKTGTEH